MLLHMMFHWMSYHLMDNFNIASMEENFQMEKCFIDFNSKNWHSARNGGQMNLCVIT